MKYVIIVALLTCSLNAMHNRYFHYRLMSNTCSVATELIVKNT